MAWKKFDDQSADKNEAPFHNPKRWYNYGSPVIEPVVVKDLKLENPSETTIHLYSDGSCKGWESSVDHRAISGWGCFLQIDSPEGKKEISYSGGIFNADAHTAELSAVLQAMIRIHSPCKIHVHSDSLYVITAMKNLPKFIAERRASIEAIPASHRSRVEKYEYQRLGLWERLNKEMEKPTIEQVTVQWLKGHQLDDMSNAIKHKDPIALRDMRGNDQADKLSHIGAIKCIVNALHDLSNGLRFKSEKTGLHIKLLEKNLKSSFFSRETAVMYLVEKPNLLTPDIISQILDADSIARINNALSMGVAIEPKHPTLNSSLARVNDQGKSKGNERGFTYNPGS